MPILAFLPISGVSGKNYCRYSTEDPGRVLVSRISDFKAQDGVTYTQP